MCFCEWSGNLYSEELNGAMPRLQAPYIPQTGSEFTADWFSDCLQEQFGAAVLDVELRVELVSGSLARYTVANSLGMRHVVTFLNQ